MDLVGEMGKRKERVGWMGRRTGKEKTHIKTRYIYETFTHARREISRWREGGRRRGGEGERTEQRVGERRVAFYVVMTKI